MRPNTAATKHSQKRWLAGTRRAVPPLLLAGRGPARASMCIAGLSFPSPMPSKHVRVGSGQAQWVRRKVWQRGVRQSPAQL